MIGIMDSFRPKTLGFLILMFCFLAFLPWPWQGYRRSCVKVFALSKAGLGSRAKIGIRKTLDCLALARDEKRLLNPVGGLFGGPIASDDC